MTDDKDEQGVTPAPRKPYEPPRLVEYGSIAKLTQGSNTFLNEGGGMRFMFPCL
jgi:hypothetical protein